VIAVTADRELIDLVQVANTEVVEPSWLFEELVE
jgi:hypothetical protein